jgi:capsular exopolysaccharide synthesis family protein
LEEVLYATNVKRLFMVFAGTSVPNPTEILEKKYFTKLIEFGREHFDYIIVDCAPIAVAIDAAVVARQCDGAILVISQGVANSRLITSVKKQLEASGVKMLGAVLNKVRVNKKGYGYGYGSYYGNGYHGVNEEGKQ